MILKNPDTSNESHKALWVLNLINILLLSQRLKIHFIYRPTFYHRTESSQAVFPIDNIDFVVLTYPILLMNGIVVRGSAMPTTLHNILLIWHTHLSKATYN